MSVDSIDIKVLKDLKSIPEGPREHARPPDKPRLSDASRRRDLPVSTHLHRFSREMMRANDVRRMPLFRSFRTLMSIEI